MARGQGREGDAVSGRAPTGDGDARALAIEIVGGALGIAADRLPADAAIGRSERWDSLAHVRIILAIEECLSRQLAPDEVVAIADLADIERLLDTP